MKRWKENSSGDIKKSTKEKTLNTVVVFLVVAILVLVAIVFLQRSAFQKGIYKETCQTKLCVETAVRVLDSMNETIEPCNDFFEFACRGWITKNPIPQNEVSYDPMDVMSDEVEMNLHKILDASDKKEDGRPIKLARAMYRTCMDRESVENLGLKPINDTFEKLGLPQGPPSDKEAHNLDIPKIVGMAQRYYGMNILVDMYIDQDMRDSTKNRLMMQQTSSSFKGFEIYLRDPVRFETIVNAQRRYIKGMMKLGGAGDKSEEYTTELMDFMTEIAKIMATPEETISENHRSFDGTIEKCQQLTDLRADRWNWTTYLNGVFEQTDVIVDPKSDTVVIIDMDYFTAMLLLMHKTSPRTIARYVWWEVYSSVALKTKHEFRDLRFEFWKTVYGLQSGSPEWQGCTRIVNSYFDKALTAAYVEKHFSVQEKKKAMEMWTDVSSSFDEMLTEIKWMDVKTKARAHRKLLAMRPFIGFPEWITDPKQLEAFYKDIEVFEGRLFDTYIHFNLIVGRRTLNSWRQIPNRNLWVTPGTTVNAFYGPTVNSVTFPAGILHTPLYGNEVEALNYGAIGALMGHELTHGFDNEGRKRDENGNVRQWWSEETLKLYLEKVECIIKQYTGYEVTQLGNNFTLNGVSTQGENIADNGGLREAFRAYKKLKARSKPQQALPGLVKYTDEQLFFLGFAQMWCGSQTDGDLESMIVRDEHSPNRFRVIGTLQNNAEFAKAWNCPRGTPMNPKHKCIVW